MPSLGQTNKFRGVPLKQCSLSLARYGSFDNKIHKLDNGMYCIHTKGASYTLKYNVMYCPGSSKQTPSTSS